MAWEISRCHKGDLKIWRTHRLVTCWNRNYFVPVTFKIGEHHAPFYSCVQFLNWISNESVDIHFLADQGWCDIAPGEIDFDCVIENVGSNPLQIYEKMNTVKNPKNLDIQKICCNHPKIWHHTLPYSNASKRCRWNCKQCAVIFIHYGQRGLGKQCRPRSDCS